MAKSAKGSRGASEGGDAPATRRDLVNVVTKSDDERPIHIHLKLDGKLIARLPNEDAVDGFLSRLPDSVFE